MRSGRAPHPGAGGDTSVPALPCPAFLLMQGRGSGGAPAGSGEGEAQEGTEIPVTHPAARSGAWEGSQPRDSPWPLQGDKAQSRLRSEERGSSHAQGREERAEGSEIPPRTRPQPLTCSGEAARGTGEGTVFSGFPVGKARGLPPAAEPPGEKSEREGAGQGGEGDTGSGPSTPTAWQGRWHRHRPSGPPRGPPSGSGRPP